MSMLPNLRVLIIDDSLADLALSRALLESHGFEPSMISEAHTLAEAINLIDTQPPELCLIDYILPDGLGIEILQRIQVHNRKAENTQEQIASIVVTGSGDEKIVADFFRSGANDYLVKSEVFDKLISSIDRVIVERLSSIASREKSLFDSVTGLLNRGSFIEYATEILEGHYDKNELSSLIYIDLDGFKEINDTLGHLAGDLYLKAAAKRIMHLGRTTDLVARIGGDEFVILLRDISRCDLIIKVDEWMRGNETFHDEAFVGRRLRCSVGVAVTNLSSVISLEQLIADADQAMYSAKKSGKDRYAFVGASRVQSSQSLESFPSSHNSHHMPPASILKALLNHEFSIFFQPIRDVESMDIQSLEVLVRWAHKPEKLAIPAIFDIFSEFNLYDQFHSWLVPTLLDCISQWQEEGCKIKFSINAPTSVQGCLSFIRYLKAGLHNNKMLLMPEFFVVEVNESLFNQDLEYFTDFMEQLASMKISTCLDQFSKTETKITTLADQHFSSVKVRRCDFDSSVGDSYTNVLRLSSFLKTCMECDLIAVGIESKGELEQVKSAGVDKVQGHFLGEPRAACPHWQDFISQYDQLDVISKR